MGISKQTLKQSLLWIFALAILICISFCFPNSIFVSSQTNNRLLPIYCVQTDKPEVALSFDAAWGNEDTMKILDILDKHNVKVTFFMTGGWVNTYPDDVKAIAAAGHDLGNHSENHKEMSKLSAKECESELMTVHKKVKELTGIDMFLFRPPYGDYNDTLITTARNNGYFPIQWDVDSLDWKNYGVENIKTTILNNKHLGNGSIILCHNGAKFTAAALDDIITGLEDKGYKIIPISKLIYKDTYNITVEGRQLKD